MTAADAVRTRTRRVAAAALARRSRGRPAEIDVAAGAYAAAAPSDDDDEPLRAPAAPVVPPRPPIPIVQAAAPVLAALLLFAITGNRATLALAVLGPLLAAGTMVDATWRRRRTVRRDARRHAEESAILERRARARHARCADRLRSARPTVDEILAGARSHVVAPPGREPGLDVSLGRATVDSGVRIEGGTAADRELEGLRARVRSVTGAPFVLRCGRLAVVGDERAVAACVRGIVVDLVAHAPGGVDLRLTGGRVAVGLRTEFEHAGLLRSGRLRGAGPTPVRLQDTAPTLEIALVPTVEAIPQPVEGVLDLRRPDAPTVRVAGGAATAVVPGRIDGAVLAGWAGGLTRPGFADATVARREPVGLDRLLADTPPRTSSPSVPIGESADGPVVIDLDEDGPHFAIGGTTGSGKSELLRTLAAGLAARYEPDGVVFIAVDFKGGATFDPLGRLPHCLGVVTDLDGDEATRLVLSLGGELRRRERLLRSAGAGRVQDLADPPPRLVVLVDEFQALVGSHPDVHDAFADLAARGRSLGIHLILGAQRPRGTMRDALLGNLSGRICLRVAEAADALAIVGSGAPAGYVSSQPGRATVRTGDGLVEVHVARCDDETLDAIVGRSRAGASVHPAPWLPPLPADLHLDAPELAGEPIAIGLIDDPEGRRRTRFVLPIRRSGGLLVLGAASSGRTGVALAAAQAAMSAGCDVVRLGGDVESAWDHVVSLEAGSSTGRPVYVVVDDLDLLADRLGERHAPEWLDRLGRVARGDDDATLVATALRVTPAVRRIASLLRTTVRLHHASRSDFALSGGDPRHHRPNLPPGRGVVDGLLVQFARPTAIETIAPRSPTPRLEAPGPGETLGIVSARSGRWVEWCAAWGVETVRPGVAPELPGGSGPADARAMIGSVTEWQRTLGGLGTIADRGRVVFDGTGAVSAAGVLGAAAAFPAVAETSTTVLVRDPDGTVRRHAVPWSGDTAPSDVDGPGG